MWTEGNINGYEYSVKVYDEASDMGINKGRISKLDVRKSGRIVASYDRGWDVRPTTEEVKAVVKEIVKQYTNKPT